jgi:mannose-1-phosphate guanylyltransferase/phosphomannomutase
MSHFLPTLLDEMGVEAVALNGMSTEATVKVHEVAFSSLSKIVQPMECDLGVHIHPAGEKVTIVTRDGVVVSPQQLLLAIAELTWRLHPKAAIAVPISATSQVEEVAKLYNGRVVRVKSDHLSMMQAAAKGDVVLVAGTRGGFIFPGWQRGADAACALANLLELVACSGIELETVLSGMKPGEFADAVVPCQWRHKGALMRKILEESSDLPREMIDGVRLRVNDTWLWIAPDRRNAHFRIQAEAPTREEANRTLSEWAANIAAWRTELEQQTLHDATAPIHSTTHA